MIEFRIARLPVPMGSYESKPLLTESWMAVSRNDDPKWIGKDNIGLEELEGIPLILMQRQAGIHCHDMVIDEMKNKGVNADVFCESDNISAILSLVEAELGIAILPVSTLSVRPSGDFHAMAIANCQLPIVLRHFVEKRQATVGSRKIVSGNVLKALQQGFGRS